MVESLSFAQALLNATDVLLQIGHCPANYNTTHAAAVLRCLTTPDTVAQNCSHNIIRSRLSAIRTSSSPHGSLVTEKLSLTGPQALEVSFRVNTRVQPFRHSVRTQQRQGRDGKGL